MEVLHAPLGALVATDWKVWLACFARWTVGLTLVVAAVGKMPKRKQFAFVVIAFRVLPRRMALIYAYTLPAVELVVGSFLILGIGSRVAAILAAMLLASFVGAIALNLVRGRVELDCGCFGAGYKRKVSGRAVASNAWLLLLAGIAIAWPQAALVGIPSVVAGDSGVVVVVLAAATLVYPLLVQVQMLRTVARPR